MKTIVIIANNDVGLISFRLELLLKLKEKYKVHVILPFGERIKELEEQDFIVHTVDVDRRGKNPFKDFKLLITYKRLLGKIKPSMVLTYTIKPNIYGGIICRIMNIPYIVNITGLGTAVENEGILQKLIVLLYKFALKKTRCVFFQNNENKDFFLNKRIIRSSKARLLPGSGVNLEKFEYVEYPNENTLEFVFISRIMHEKGIDQYLEMAKYIKCKYVNTRFHICGFCEENYEDTLKKLQEKEIIIYHGMVKNVKVIIAQTHCTVHPSFYPEGMSNVCLESAACGRPVITTNRSGCRETVDDGVTGYIVNQKDNEDLIEKIERFIALSYEEKKKMGLMARAKMEREFDRRIVVKAYMEEIEEDKQNKTKQNKTKQNKTKQNKTKQNIPSLTVLRVISALMVLYIHLPITTDLFLYQVPTRFAVPIFFTISAFFWSDSKLEFNKKCCITMLKILVRYLIWVEVTFVYEFIVLGYTLNNINELISEYLKVILNTQRYMIGMLWFIITLFWCFIIMVLLYNTKCIKIVTVLSFLYYVLELRGIVTYPVNNSFLPLYYIAKNFKYVLAGYYIRKYRNIVVDNKYKVVWRIIGTTGILLYLRDALMYKQQMIALGVQVVYFESVWMDLVIAALLIFFLRNPLSNISEKITFFIGIVASVLYFSQRIVIDLLKRLFVTNFTGEFIGTVIVCLFISTILYVIFMRFPKAKKLKGWIL